VRLLGEVGDTKVWDRFTLLGGARGPPGTVEGGFVRLIGREMFRTVGLFLTVPITGPADIGLGVDLPGGKRSFFERLAFRPKDAKNPAPFVDGVGANERTDDGGVPLPALELERVG